MLILRPRCLVLLFLFALTFRPALLLAQTDSTVAGRVTDASGATIANAQVEITNIDRGTVSQTRSNASGIYVLSGVSPGRYNIEVRHEGFSQVDLTNLVVNVQSNIEYNFKLQVGSVSESVTVDGSGLQLNTTDASVSTVVDRNFVDNMPLNGRSFQSLILLAPGTVTATPQNGAQQSYSGEFSVNGQRADANNFTVDGVSANNSPNPYGGTTAGSAGGLQATTALGTTQALVSVDALQEFKVQTSTYSAEYGRQPGAQISFETRSGTNNWHGSAFDYLRNNVFDANNWFNDDTTPITAKPVERQNDFGGTLGGPLGIPRLYSAKDRTFFFFSYEGLRLTQPQPATVNYVPSTELRQAAPAALQPALDAFPLPNCTIALSAECVDPENGLSPFLLSISLPSHLDAISARVDQRAASWLNLFFRYSSADSSAETYAGNFTVRTTTSTQTFTLGGDGTFGSNLTNLFRLNYSPATASAPYTPATYGGGTPADYLALNSIDSPDGFVAFGFDFGAYYSFEQQGVTTGKQHQWNLVDTVAWKRGNHLFRAGLDYRRTSVTAQFSSPEINYYFQSAASVLANSPEASASVAAQQRPEYTNFSAFIQDEWHVTQAINLSLGLRWELNPPPAVTSGPGSRTVNGNFAQPSSLTLAPAGTPLYHTTYYNFAPRIGMAVVLRNTSGRELVFRGGGGVFFDTGQQANSIFGDGASPGTGFSQYYDPSPANAFPFTEPLSIPLDSTLVPPYYVINMISQHLQLPYAYQWNATLEQALGTNQAFSIGYIGSNGRRLLNQNLYSPNNPDFTNIEVYANGLSSSYNSLQVQYKRTLSSGLQALASYTWSHAIDYESQDASLFPYKRGNSDFDVGNNFTAALSYDLPRLPGSHFANALLGGWGTDLRFTARTAFPVTLEGNYLVDPVTGKNTYGELNYLGGPLYQDVASAPGGRVINASAFALPSDSSDPGNAPRNFVRGFGENELNFALRRTVPLYEQVHLQFRAEAFNVFNHPNFGYIDPAYGDALFGQATETLASSIGGLTSLYQQGGPRSLQFSLRLQF